jgi:RNA polymerase sigma factor (sigma-70 family)
LVLGAGVNELIHYIRAAVPAHDSAEVPDGVLLDRFASRQDEAAFAALVGRHGGTVWSACRRLLDREQDAEDAFQATFLTLSRKAGSIRDSSSLPAWLHEVARRIAANLRRDARRRADTEAAAATLPRSASADLARREAEAALDEELARLPERYRGVLLVCCLDGWSRDEAAARLGLSPGQVKGRLERAREMLRRRLEARGLHLGAALLGADAAHPAAAGAVTPAAAPASLVSSTVAAGVAFVLGPGTKAGVVSPQVLLLTEGALSAMFLRKITTVAAVLLATAIAGTGALTYRAALAAPGSQARAALTRAPAPAPKDTRAEETRWGKPLRGLRLGLCRAEAKGHGKVLLRVVLDNVSNEDLTVNLGLMLGNGKKQLATAVRLTFTSAGGKERALHRKVGGVAGRLDPFGVPLAAGCRYQIACDLEDYIDEDAARMDVPLEPGPYRVRGELVGKAPANTAGLALMHYWTGTIDSGEIQVTVPARPAR